MNKSDKKIIIFILLAGVEIVFVLRCMSRLFASISTAPYFDIILSFLFIAVLLRITYMLVNNLQNDEGNFNKVADIIFFLIFFIFLCFPMLGVNKEKISERENRNLAEWKPLFSDNHNLNYNFGKDFDNWFNDRFMLRNIFIDSYNFIRFIIAGYNDKGLYIKSSDFIYSRDDCKIASKVLVDELSELVRFNEWCKRYNIKLYVLIVPDRADIYAPNPAACSVFVPYDSGDARIANNVYFLGSVTNINKEKNMHIVYPYWQLFDNKDKQIMFYHTDHHWTNDAAFIGYTELMSEISKDFPTVKTLTYKDFDYTYSEKIRKDFDKKFITVVKGSSAKLTGFNFLPYLNKTKYRYFWHKNNKELTQKWFVSPERAEKIFEYPKGADYRVVVLGTSNNEMLMEFIPYTFKHVKYIRTNALDKVQGVEEDKIMKYNEKKILDFKPDIVIFGISTFNVAGLSNLFNME